MQIYMQCMGARRQLWISRSRCWTRFDGLLLSRSTLRVAGQRAPGCACLCPDSHFSHGKHPTQASQPWLLNGVISLLLGFLSDYDISKFSIRGRGDLALRHFSLFFRLFKQKRRKKVSLPFCCSWRRKQVLKPACYAMLEKA